MLPVWVATSLSCSLCAAARTSTSSLLVLSTFSDNNLSLYIDVFLKSFQSPCESTITEYLVFMLLQIQFTSHVVKSCTAFLFCSANTSFNESVLEFFIPTVARSAACVRYEDKAEVIYDGNNAQVGQQLDEGKLPSSINVFTGPQRCHNGTSLSQHTYCYMSELLPGYTPNSEEAVTLATAA